MNPNPSLTDQYYNDFEARWIASTNEEAASLVADILAHPSRKWLDLMSKAEKNAITHSDVLLANSNKIYESIAEATADEDGLVIPYKS